MMCHSSVTFQKKILLKCFQDIEIEVKIFSDAQYLLEKQYQSNRDFLFTD